MALKLVVVAFGFLFVAAQAAQTRLGYNTPQLGEALFGGRIVDGEDAEKGEFPHQVSLQWGMPPLIAYRHFCGGSIIDNQWIVTAGHCVQAVPPIGSFAIKAGKYNIAIKEADEQVIEVQRTIVHEKYEGDVGPYDIALLKLARPLTFNDAVKAINLPELGVTPVGDSVLSGWGSISANGKQLPNILQKASLPVIDIDSCKEKLESLVGPSPLHSTNVCTVASNGETSACSGDSGGPLVRKHASGDSELIGVVSWGVMPCGSQGAPSVFVDVGQFVDWIKSITA